MGCWRKAPHKMTMMTMELRPEEKTQSNDEDKDFQTKQDNEKQTNIQT